MPGYIQKIRQKLGSDCFIHPAARIIVEHDDGQIVLVQRRDNGQWGLPAGALEEGETIDEAIRREVREETGLVLGEIHLIGLSTAPEQETVRYPNGDIIQYFTAEFYCNDWSGEINPSDEDEVRTAAFLPAEYWQQLPPNEQSARESLQHFRRHQSVMLK